MPNIDQGIRQTVIEGIYDAKRSLIQKSAEALGPGTDAHALTAQEEEFAWDYPDPQETARRATVWAEEMGAAAKSYPDLLPAGMTPADVPRLFEPGQRADPQTIAALDALKREARPHVGARLFKFRPQVVGSAGRVDIRDQADYADRLLARVKANRGEEEPDQTDTSEPSEPEQEAY